MAIVYPIGKGFVANLASKLNKAKFLLFSRFADRREVKEFEKQA